MWPTYPTSMQIEMLTLLNQSLYPVAPAQALLKLYQNDIVPDANSEVGDFTEADYSGYADINVTMSAVALNDSNVPVCQSNLCHFQPTATTVTNTVYGIYITDSTGAILIAAQRFTTPQPMSTVFSVVAGVWRASMPLSNYGWLSVE